ncbi:MAG TPA: hydantoinase/oxoprolinase N-terminal domain-containing protein, partial [Anaerolineae bacterium]|nr:hydantoinase/oxoprolinase N-terminal domain-containing protein [Anaerolineae bacterium]
MGESTYRVGIDIGGTFTDAVVITSEGEMHIFKSPSTPTDSSIGLFNCLKKASAVFGLELGDFLRSVTLLVHGTTVATNTMLQYSGAKTGLITTRGFRDALEMRRAHKENIWDLSLAPPPPIIPRHLRLGVPERINYAGDVVVPLDEEETRLVVR